MMLVVIHGILNVFRTVGNCHLAKVSPREPKLSLLLQLVAPRDQGSDDEMVDA